jgi:hypothetical protein
LRIWAWRKMSHMERPSKSNPRSLDHCCSWPRLRSQMDSMTHGNRTWLAASLVRWIW